MMSYSGKEKIIICKRLGSSWEDLADYFEIPTSDQNKFKLGNEVRDIWTWLKERNKLQEMSEALEVIERQDILKTLKKLKNQNQTEIPANKLPCKQVRIPRNIIKGYNLGDLITELYQHMGYEGSYCFSLDGPHEILKDYVVERILEVLPDTTRRKWKRYDIRIYTDDLNAGEKVVEERLKKESICQQFSDLFSIPEDNQFAPSEDILLIIWNRDIQDEQLIKLAVCSCQNITQKAYPFLAGKSRCLAIIWANTTGKKCLPENFTLLPIPNKFKNLDELEAWFRGELKQVEINNGQRLEKSEIEKYVSKIKDQYGDLIGTYQAIQDIILELRGKI